MEELRLIAIAAKAAGVSESTLRNYCRAGLIIPIRDSSGRRLFRNRDIKAVREVFLENLNRARK